MRQTFHFAPERMEITQVQADAVCCDRNATGPLAWQAQRPKASVKSVSKRATTMDGPGASVGIA